MDLFLNSLKKYKDLVLIHWNKLRNIYFLYQKNLGIISNKIIEKFGSHQSAARTNSLMTKGVQMHFTISVEWSDIFKARP